MESSSGGRPAPIEARIEGLTRPVTGLVTLGRRPGVASPAVERNARLTAAVGVLLIAMLAVEGVTILSIRRLLPVHYFVGLLIVPPVLLKLATTGSRFARYYLRSREYRAAAPPAPILRILGPVLILSTVAVIVTGVELWLFGDRFGLQWLTLHKASFVIWLGATAIHVLGHLDRAVILTLRDVLDRPRLRGRVSRGAWLAGSLLAGTVLAATTLFVQSPFVVPTGR